MNQQQRKTLLKIARDTVDAVINRTETPRPKSDDPQLNEKCGCFVTLKNGEHLRGCIGQFTSEMPLVELIEQMAMASATTDPRFLDEPITPDELLQLHIEISVLSPLKKTDDPLSLELGKDGIYIKRGVASGCFLPQVATETGWSEEEFLSYCCSHKAGLPPDAWKDAKTNVYLFTAEVFGEDFNKI
ncbi:MAG: AmmeMemoRadiSam system protein A [Sedimentisphaerales bacterium]|nr:AmmeMemoRadiSam system protein A [Sedimentisphaerales bacterium]